MMPKSLRTFLQYLVDNEPERAKVLLHWIEENHMDAAVQIVEILMAANSKGN